MADVTRTRNPRGQGERLRAALMDAARELLLELGDQDKLSVRAVTARAGVSPNALYLHFADREALLSAVMIASYKELRAFLQAAVAPDGDPIEQLRAYAEAYLRFAEQRPGIYRVLFMTKVREGVPIPAAGAPSGQDEGVDAFNDLLGIVTRALAGGRDPFTQTAYLWAGLHGYVALRQVIPAFPWPPEREYVDRMIDAHVQADTGRPSAEREP
ncbi:MAG: TetR/AcrR family transcriptional regulator [Solirubrobacteraceae bacterium]|jgi:AcrR family transcriptional regulator